ncbi:MAG: ATP-dependent Clp protease ATP-binding subunit ClpX, partial [Ruminococcaceae bacterium]|nr:ATP-dependent Clp protease ATP-binding subunit ClpX [Oscillospiraceae bacterium]
KAIARNIGARGLRAVMEELLTRIMYDIPSDPTVVKAVINKDCVEGKGEPVLTRDPEKVSYSVKLNSGKDEQSDKGTNPKSAS